MSFISKYDPKKFDDVVFQDAATEQSVRNWLQPGQQMPIMLYGGYGTGKTTLAKLLPFELHTGLDPSEVKMVHADSKNNFATKLNSITQFARLTALSGGPDAKRCVIIDEFDNLTNQIQQNLKGHLNALMPHANFIFTTNNLQGVDGGIRSRSYDVSIEQAKPAAWLPRARHIMQCEGLAGVYDNRKLLRAITNGGGDSRKILQRLEALVLKANPIFQQPITQQPVQQSPAGRRSIKVKDRLKGGV